MTDEQANGAQDPGTIDRTGLHQRTIDELRTIWRAYLAGLPVGHESWRRGAAYARESSARSMTRESPAVQLTYTLSQFAQRQIWVPWEAVFFDNASGTSIAARDAFKRLLEQALAGGYSIIGAYSSDRYFRNAREAQEIKGEFRRRGIELDYMGKPGGDPRSSMLWQMERNQELLDEWWPRKTSENVGRALEHLTRAGRPIGKLPEGYVVAERAPSFQGEPGRILSYARNEPLATIIAEGKDRYLAGATYQQVATWSLTTELKGVTPKGSPMNVMWWQATLANPKYAGLHRPTTYMGFRPGIESPKRQRRKNGVTPLVPCILPALYPAADWERVVSVGLERHRGPKRRPTYRTSLFSSISYDERCGHRLTAYGGRGDGRYMRCKTWTADGRHSSQLRVDLAERQLDELIGSISLNDPGLLSMVERELDAMNDEIGALRPSPVDPQIGRIEAALAALGDIDSPFIRAPLLAHLDELKRAQEARRLERVNEATQFRASIRDLRHWSQIWQSADTRSKNELLRAAGVRVYVNREVERTPARISYIEAADPVFALAIAVATERNSFDGPTSVEPRNDGPLIRLPDAFIALLRSVRLEKAA